MNAAISGFSYVQDDSLIMGNGLNSAKSVVLRPPLEVRIEIKKILSQR